MVKVVWSNQSIRDIDGIAAYIALDSIRYAKITVARLRKASKQIREFPYVGRVVAEVDDVNLRELIIGNYRMIYVIMSKSEIVILTIHHSSRLVSPGSILRLE